MPPPDLDPVPCVEAVSVAEKVAFLAAPAAYTPKPERVEVIETHMAWVFLAGSLVYKLKKPVRYPFLDFSTCALRGRTCGEEIRLNRRLAPEVYCGTVPLTRESDGRLAVDGAGSVVDWLVKMRRLPEARMLDRAIRVGTVCRRDIDALAGVLGAFYARATPVRLTGPDYVSRFAREQATNRDILASEEFSLEPETRDRVLDAIDTFLQYRSDLLEERASDGRVVEGHGDLRPEHVCLIDPPVVIDCLEFNRDLRVVDPFDELSFLGLECELLGAPWIGEVVVEQCADRLGSRPAAELLSFYTAYRACLRARLTLVHLIEPQPREPEKWLPLAKRYLELAERACLMLHPQ